MQLPEVSIREHELYLLSNVSFYFQSLIRELATIFLEKLQKTYRISKNTDFWNRTFPKNVFHLIFLQLWKIDIL
jgi:hypothetical protein